jgi:hypothetical protein
MNIGNELYSNLSYLARQSFLLSTELPSQLTVFDTLYKKSVLILQKNKYPRQDFFMLQRSFDGKNYICSTCHAKLLKGQQPCKAVVNNLFVDETPTELAALEKLEQILVAQRIVFEKIVIMPKGQQRKIKGAISCMFDYIQLAWYIT